MHTITRVLAQGTTDHTGQTYIPPSIPHGWLVFAGIAAIICAFVAGLSRRGGPHRKVFANGAFMFVGLFLYVQVVGHLDNYDDRVKATLGMAVFAVILTVVSLAIGRAGLKRAGVWRHRR